MLMLSVIMMPAGEGKPINEAGLVAINSLSSYCGAALRGPPDHRHEYAVASGLSRHKTLLCVVATSVGSVGKEFDEAVGGSSLQHVMALARTALKPLMAAICRCCPQGAASSGTPSMSRFPCDPPRRQVGHRHASPSVS